MQPADPIQAGLLRGPLGLVGSSFAHQTRRTIGLENYNGDFLLQIVAVPFKRFTKVENLKGECSPDVLNLSVGKTQHSKKGEYR